MAIKSLRAAFFVFSLFMALHATARAAEFRLSSKGIGPIMVSMSINVRNAKDELTAFPDKIAELTASARNDTGRRIRYAEFCVQAERRTEGCDFRIWTGRVWEPGEELSWLVDAKSRRGIENPRIMLVKLKLVP